jgi:hypothetical protein
VLPLISNLHADIVSVTGFACSTMTGIQPLDLGIPHQMSDSFVDFEKVKFRIPILPISIRRPRLSVDPGNQ